MMPTEWNQNPGLDSFSPSVQGAVKHLMKAVMPESHDIKSPVTLKSEYFSNYSEIHETGSIFEQDPTHGSSRVASVTFRPNSTKLHIHVPFSEEASELFNSVAEASLFWIAGSNQGRWNQTVLVHAIASLSDLGIHAYLSFWELKSCEI